MGGRWKLFFSLGLLLSLIGLQFFISKGERNSPSEPSLTTSPDQNQVVQSLSGVHIVENNGLKQVWELWASKGSLDNKNTWNVNNIKVNFLSDNGMVYEVTSPHGVIESTLKQEVLKLKLLKDVITKSSSGYTFYSKEAEYNKSEHELFFPGPIKMTGPVKNSQDIIVTGTNMTIYLKTNVIKIHRDIFASHKGTTDITTLTADSVFLNGQKKVAKFMGNVNIKMTEFNVKCNLASFNFNKKILISAILEEDLTATVDDKKITAQKLLVDFIHHTYTFQGSSLLESETESLSGDEIVILDQGRRIKVSNAKAVLNPKAKPKPIRQPKIN